MNLLTMLLVAAVTLGLCFAVDRLFIKAFRSKQQHKSGLAVRASKNYGLFGLILIILGILAVGFGIASNYLLLVGGIVVLLMGAAMAAYYLSFGIFYDGESFLYSSFGKKSTVHYFRDIVGQKLYVVTGGNVIIELHMKDGSAVSLQSAMDGVYMFLDTAFAGWCLETGRDPQDCGFHDPANSLWFPTVEDA